MAAKGRRPAVQHFRKSAAEISIAKCIKGRVESLIDVAQPKNDFEEIVDNAVGTDGHHQEEDEVRQPAGDKGAHYVAQLPGSYPLLLRYRPQCSGRVQRRIAGLWPTYVPVPHFTALALVSLLADVANDVFYFDSDVDVMRRTLLGVVDSAAQFQLLQTPVTSGRAKYTRLEPGNDHIYR